MANLNRVFLMGNLTRDPELRYIPSGQAVTTFSLAINRVYTQNGERKEDTSFVRIVTWARLAETCGQYLKKGSPAFIEGRLQSRSWETQDGQKRSTMEVVASSVQFLNRAPKDRERTSEGVDISTAVPDIPLDEPAKTSSQIGPGSGSGQTDSSSEVPF
jgi:single-strand DNA-binding protein